MCLLWFIVWLKWQDSICRLFVTLSVLWNFKPCDWSMRISQVKLTVLSLVRMLSISKLLLWPGWHQVIYCTSIQSTLSTVHKQCELYNKYVDFFLFYYNTETKQYIKICSTSYYRRYRLNLKNIYILNKTISC